MRIIATVVELNGSLATVESERTSACQGCHKMAEGKGCSVCSLMGSGKKMRSFAQNEIHAKIGDRVWVETATSRVLFYAAAVFLFPLLLAVCGWFAAGIFTKEPLWKAVGAAVCFCLAFIVLRIYSGVLKKRNPDAVIVSIISETENETY